MPLDGTNVMDVEFVDDTSLYLNGQLTNLQKISTTQQTFCTTSFASINCNKSVGIWVAQDSTPQWCPHLDFRWILEGNSVRNLGWQGGLNISTKNQVAPLLLKIRVNNY